MPIINSLISASKNPTGTKTITANGVVDVSDYANADVQVPTSAPERYIKYKLNSSDKLVKDESSTAIMDFSTIKELDEYSLAKAYYNNLNVSGIVDFSSLYYIASYGAQYAFYGCTNITKVKLNSYIQPRVMYSSQGMFQGCTGITELEWNPSKITNGYSCSGMFSGCTSLTSVDFSNLETIQGPQACENMFSGCTSLTSVDLSKFSSVSNGSNCCRYMFQNCTSLNFVDLSSLVNSDTSSYQWMFSGCTSLRTLQLSSLKTLNYLSCSGMLQNCTNLDVYFSAINTTSFGSRTDQMQNLIYGGTNVTLHFPKNLNPQSGSTIISSLNSYPNFGGTNTVLEFDLPSTFILTGNNSTKYERNPKYDTLNALAWRINNSNILTAAPYYTSGTTDPQIGDTIYSDSACTTSVTTIDSIA